ncbi:serine/threonine-protein kinase [Paractinoplanes globisporus]|uniref:Protein kinase n=1 Tax=Paractinoplanes globisporus TaxID=113565 RepID=A0ABW6WCI6_9ACTN|nr:serine/threonine-protein kinase [Actinoplanes globisporus]
MTDEWPSAGTLLATRYRLVALLETGGMAQIWQAGDELLGRPVAIKLPTGPQVAWREARMAAKLSHPGIAAVHDYREAVRPDGTVAPFVVMELLAGETVAARLVRETFTWQEAARVGAAVADALASAHKGGVVHRDIKPGNVMLTPTGVKILDFGISAAAGEPDDDDTGATFGTPAYVAPERLDGMPAEPATDVYGLGVLLFEMVTGQPPYPVDTWDELDEARLKGPDVLPETLPADFRAVVNRCLSEDPADRPPADTIRFELTALWLAEQPEKDEAAEPALEPEPAIEAPAEPAPSVAAAADSQPSRRPRVAELWPSQPPARPTSPSPNGFSTGRVAAATLPITEPQPRRRLALALALLALLVTAGGIYVVIHRPKERVAATPPAPANPATPFFSPNPATDAPTAAPTTTPPTSATPSPTPKLSFDDAVSRLRSAVEDSAARGKMRSDVALDLLNLIRPLEYADTNDIEAQVSALRIKISGRAREGSLTAAQASLLRARLADVDRAAGM